MVLLIILILLVIIGALIPTIGQAIASKPVTKAELTFHSIDILSLGTTVAEMRVKGDVRNDASLGGIFDNFPIEVSLPPLMKTKERLWAPW